LDTGEYKIEKMRKIILFCLSIMLFSSVIAYYPYYGYFSPYDILNNEWLMFVLVFLVFFAIIFFALNKTFKENKGPAIVIALIISLFISATISQRYYLQQFVGDWGIVLGILIIVGFLIKILYDRIGLLGIMIVVTGFLLYLQVGIDPYEVLPYEVLASPIFEFYYNFRIFLLLIIGGITVYMVVRYLADKKYRDAYKRKVREETIKEFGR